MTAAAGASDPNSTVPFHIDGKDHHPAASFDVVSPLDGKLAHRCGSASMADADAAIAAAADALKTWRTTTPTQRRDIFLRAADVMLSRRQELTGFMAKETGATIPWCEFNIDTASNILKDLAGRIPTLEGSFPALMDPGCSAIVMREPYGVVFAVAPWYGATLFAPAALLAAASDRPWPGTLLISLAPAPSPSPLPPATRPS